jgi:PAS domain S-box-containing protein
VRNVSFSSEEEVTRTEAHTEQLTPQSPELHLQPRELPLAVIAARNALLGVGTRSESADNHDWMAGEPKPIDLKQTLKPLGLPSFVVNEGGIVTWLNDSAKTTFGNLERRPFTSVVAPEDVPTVQRQLERQLREEVPATDYQVDILTPDGRRRRAEISSVRIPGGDRYHAILGVALARGRRESSAPPARLTPRQTQVLQMLSEGASTDQIAAELHLSKETVRNHVRHILRSLGVHSRIGAVTLARRQGLLPDS